MKYIVNKDGKVVGIIKIGEPDKKDLESREEFIVNSSERIPLMEAEYKDGKIVKYVKTPEEIEKEKQLREEMQRESLIQQKIRKMAEQALIDEGKLKPEEVKRGENKWE